MDREANASSEPTVLERIALARALAELVWEDTALAHDFMESVQPQLGGCRPIDLASTDSGLRRVEALLMKIEHALPV